MKNVRQIMVLALSLFTLQACAKYEEKMPVIVSVNQGQLSLAASEAAVYDANNFDIEVSYRSAKNEAWSAPQHIYDQVWMIDGVVKTNLQIPMGICGTVDRRNSTAPLNGYSMAIPETFVRADGNHAVDEAVLKAVNDAKISLDADEAAHFENFDVKAGGTIKKYKTSQVKFMKITFHYVEDGQTLFLEREVVVNQ